VKFVTRMSRRQFEFNLEKGVEKTFFSNAKDKTDENIYNLFEFGNVCFVKFINAYFLFLRKYFE